MNHEDAKDTKKNLIYLDVCALSRPFDDQGFLRIRLETEAVNLILSKVRQGLYGLLVSPVHIEEIESIEDPVERIELQTMLATWGQPVTVDRAKTMTRAEELERSRIGIADAAHIAFAEESGAPFISVDDRLVKKCAGIAKNIWYGNPVAFCEKEELR
ncbi:PIN domain-containing protein [Thermodesulfobacteriota bacterium]